MNKEKATEITTEFFKRRFPEKNLKFEIECGYFNTWIKRFMSNNVKCYCDDISLKVVTDMKNERKLE